MTPTGQMEVWDLARPPKSQEDRILDYLRHGNSITPLEALNKFCCFRLSGRIFDLKAKGYNIAEEIVSENGKHFAKYSLVE